MASYLGRGAASNGTVYVSNLPPGTSETMLADYFGTIGLLKVGILPRTSQPKIWMYKDKITNEPKGDATVTYEDPHAASAAVEWFHNKEFHGNIIEVGIAESKGKESFDLPSIQLSDPSVGGGRGRGRGEGKPWQQDGDWPCPNTSCGNVNFAFRVRQRSRSWFGRGHGGNDAGGRGRGAGGPTGLFGPNDWPCPMCGNINWAKRMKCNICNTNKPGHSEGGGGRAGGYKELDEEEIEETRRRRREAEDDGEMYDEFGNLKKKFRAKMQQGGSGSALPGSGRAGWEVEDLGRESRERSKDGGRSHSDREGSRTRDRERERPRSRSRERERPRDRTRDRDQDRSHGREQQRDRHRDW
ncbi:unnamed protein product [Spirodela intermedia]|uniref:Uncharacterized protein n=1 Tax=Spirodela intermedia TaxID=51605 RepID=A0A7I8JNQ7_SPIIN|nr:unnamed protein product [Spirodela intermedia]CAA6671808.1 unnamed protein product [Spirodela intermedia]